MVRRSSKMPENPDPENPDKDAIDEGRLPPSDITTLAQSDDIDLDDMSTEELLTLIEDALDRLPVEELVTIRDAAETKRLEHLEEAKNAILEEMPQASPHFEGWKVCIFVHNAQIALQQRRLCRA